MFRGLSNLIKRLFQSRVGVNEYECRIESHFDIVIPDSDVGSINTLGDLRDCIARQREAQGQPLPIEEIWTNVRRITSEQLGVREDELHPGIRFEEDLCYGC